MSCRSSFAAPRPRLTALASGLPRTATSDERIGVENAAPDNGEVQNIAEARAAAARGADTILASLLCAYESENETDPFLPLIGPRSFL
mmetsp:Transcript_8767/g.20437  ORF Transcript_8767/g.20437 Transcript_8767/m.20437 type:complete len:88 (+) Transcript_8767:394-657(+)